MLVDVHTHYLPGSYRRLLADWGRPVRVEQRDGQEVVVHTTGSLALTEGFVDLDARVEWMDDHGVDRTVAMVSTPNPNVGPFTVEESTELVRAVNDGFAEAKDDHPNRIAPLGSLPLRDPEAAVEELDRIDGDLGLNGVKLPSSVRGETKLSAPELEPVFDRLDELDLPAFMHPGRNALCDQLAGDEWMFTPAAVFPTETTFQLGRLIFDGFFDRHDFDLVVAHLGGALPFLVGRFERARDQFRSDPDAPPARPIVEYAKRFYYDTISFHEPAVRAAIDTVGVDRLLFGTDYPFGMEKIEWSLRDVDELSLSAGDRAGVEGETAAALFDL